MIACTAIFRPLPSSFMLWASRNASSPKTAASSCCSSIFFLSKILPSSLSAFSVSRLSAEMSCVGLSRMSMVPSAMTTSIVRSASHFVFYSCSCASSCFRRLSSNASDISSRSLMASFSWLVFALLRLRCFLASPRLLSSKKILLSSMEISSIFSIKIKLVPYALCKCLKLLTNLVAISGDTKASLA